MLFRTQISALLLAFALLTISMGAFGHTKSNATRGAAIPGMTLFPLEDLKPGMKGVARTVFSGSEPQDFGLEILGVLSGFTGPRQSTIIARLDGPNVEKTGVFAGMSGSPVFIDN